ncbi:serine/threonine-protein kinase Tor [Phlebotomus argentipes]|uniref:serine/threonine-protein kinase Tor n=1 Tax=Phlebotomus argentipes TaxID=94469 RepID=UPI0028932008|nr:serine/threonine-protein kinase Tor [Phlebotomus argentipes]XP_059613045.1 serine/threonine-protein kinase Tor [Phlebotomus argentipes]
MSHTVQQFVTGLKSRNRDVQNKAAQDLLLFVKTELRELPQDEPNQFFDEFNHHIFDMVSSADLNEKKGGVLAIKCLISGDVVNTTTRISRYSNNLRNLLPSSDVSVMEIAAKTLVKLALLPGSKGAESFEFDIKRAFEWLAEDRNEGKRHAAVIVLRELAVAMPTYFYQQVGPFFDHIFNAIRDPKPIIREGAGQALRATLIVTCQRENVNNKPQWYRTCYDESLVCFGEVPLKEKGVTKDDRVHGALIVLNEVMRCSNSTWERKYNSLKCLQPERKRSISEDYSHIFPRFKAPFIDKWHNSPQTSWYTYSFELDCNSKVMGNVQESLVCRQLVMENFQEICMKVMEQRISRSFHVQQILLSILPRLAAFNREIFVQNYLNDTIIYLLNIIRNKEKASSIAYTTLGSISVAVEKDIEKFLPRIMKIVKVALPVAKEVTSKKKISFDSAVFVCITMLGHAVKGTITQDVKEMLDSMFATGLSPGLTICLRELAEDVPQLKPEITEGLLRMLSQVLMNKKSHQTATWGTPKHNIAAQFASLTVTPDAPAPDSATIVLALKTLGTFDFEEHRLLEFVQRCADHFLCHDQQEIRLEAVQTCSRLLKVAIQSTDTNSVCETLKQTVANVLDKLLVVGITDVDPNVRLRVLRCLDDTFDSQLALPESLSALLITLNDEVFEIRELAIITIGRLSAMNPAYVMPSLRKTLVQLLTELEHSGMSRNKEQSARMLDHLIVNTPKIISAYMRPILGILVPKLKEPDSNPGVVLNVLRAIGDLAEVNGGSCEMEKWADELLTILLDLLSDSGSPDKRGVALWTLGQLVGATGRVVTPYYKYPFLIDILINFLKTEQQPSIRRETIKVLGLLGALDPYKHKMNKGLIDGQQDNILISVSDLKSDEHTDLSTAEMLVNMGNQLDEYYPAVAIATLMRILRDPTLAQHHTSVVQAVTFIFKSLGIKCVPYLSQVLPSLLGNVRTADMNLKEFLFQQLSILIEIVKQHIISYMEDIFKLIKEFWTINTPLQATLINLVEKIAIALGCEFKVYLSQLMPQILRVFSHDTSKDRIVTVKLMQALQKFGNNLDDYLHLIIPPIVKLFDPQDTPQSVCVVALETINYLAGILDFTGFSSRIIHALVRTLDSSPDLRPAAMQALCALVIQLGKKYLVFVPLVHRVMVKHQILCVEYDKLIPKIQSNTTVCLDDEFRLRQARFKNREVTLSCSDTNTIKKLHVQASGLEVAWQAARRVSKDDWLEWLRQLSIGLLKESQSPALRSCRTLAHNYNQLLRDLFNAAFVSCWTELNDDKKKALAESLQRALMVPDLPEITQTILNLAEFMEHCDKEHFPIDPRLLGERAMECRAYAKALHYKEREFHSNKNHQVYESLIHINNKLQQKEAAEGLLEFVTANSHAGEDIKIQVRWLEKLHSWDKALDAYRKELKTTPDHADLILGEMRCLEAMGEWEELGKVVNDKWETLGEEGQSRAGRLAAVATWGLQDWERMHEYVSCIPEDTQDGAFYRAVLSVHYENYENAQRLIDQTRDLLDTELTAMAGESYERAYGAMVCVQMLAELEEVIQYKLVPERRQTIKEMWWKRLQGGQRLVEDWQRIIQVHSLVVSPQEDVHTWLKYASLCRKSSSLKLSEKTLVMLLHTDPNENPDAPLPINQPHVTFAYIKHMWMMDRKDKAYEQLKWFVNTYSVQNNCANGEEVPEDNRRLLARCYMRLGLWQNTIEGITDASVKGILSSYEQATKHDPSWYKAWHSWAYMNFKVIQSQKHQLDSQTNDMARIQKEKQIIDQYAVPAVAGFFQSINLSQGNSLQDTLRLLTLWFDYGQYAEVFEALVEGMRIIEINTWLQVIPQLIARIDTNRNLVGQLIHQLLIDIGKSHPQALVYPLTVASKSASVARKKAAHKILQSLCEHSPTLVEQAMMCSDELIRVAILWHEQWHEGLEEASRLYFGERNIKGMFDTLEPLHAMLERGPQTLKETSFNQAYGRDLTEALEWCQHYKMSGNIRDLNQAWDLYYHVFRRISRQLPQLTSLELQYVSPKLLACKDLELAVPGSYSPGQELIRISQFQINLQVITSKQRPRKLCIRGSNGKDYMFLLKGHEDLRQDERVMQLFGLVNTLLLNDPDTFRRNLTIQRYAVIPLSTNSGLIGWVPHCDTLHTLIRDYREKQKKLLNIEHRTMLRMAPDYDHLMLMQKVEVFEYALEDSDGDDLARLLWLKSPSSEVWFDRRTNYTRSLAVMSMVGYILGLGDRHPSNLMLDRLSGKILHIDFGDCFEVAMTREKFPEKIPFRLTRMLINAMEVTGIEGTYRRTCESVMTVLRKNKDSLMAVLEAFVYDPLLNWRLLDTKIDKGRRSKTAIDVTGGAMDSLGGSADDTIDLLSIGNQNAKAAKVGQVESTGNEANGACLPPPTEATNKKARMIVDRVKQKLTGNDFPNQDAISVQKQVDLLIQQATNNENLCQCYIGWCPFW